MLRVPFTRRTVRTARQPAEIGAWLATARDSALGSHCGEILSVDISSVELVNSRELGEIAKLQLTLREQGKRLVLENAQQQIYEVFDITRMNRLVDIHPSEKTVLQ